ncbi:MAG TPA: ABC transporter ATP-binding protein [Candidatus Sulfobium mesophilum]|nr:ABC transporter ATP-binding protein [Candidatus Sulfobium mesophilum]
MEDYRRIFRLVMPYWRRVAMAVLAGVIVSGMNAAIAWLAKPAMDDVLIRKDKTLLFLLPLAIFFIFLGKGIFTYIQEYLMRSASQKMVMQLRNRLYSHITELPLGYFGKNSSGELISKVINDTSMLQELVSLTIKDLFRESATALALVFVALWRRWDLTLISITVLPTALYGVGTLGKRMRQISRRAQEKISRITEFLTESFSGIKIIKAFCRQPDESRRFEEITREYYRENMRAIRVTESSTLLMEAVGGLGIAFVIWYGARLIFSNTMTVGDFTSFLTAIFLVYTPAKRLARINIGIQQARPPLERIHKLLSEPVETDGIEELKPISKYIEFKGVSFAYPAAKHKALDNLNLTVKRGEIIAIVGKSGGGKTTLANLLPRFYVPTEGVVFIDGTDISRVSAVSLRGQFGIVSQEVILFNDTVASNISYGKPSAPKEEIIVAAKAAYAHDFIMELPHEYDTVVGERGTRLSGGQRQRLSIARAVLKNPPILILDEATSSLDTASEMMVQRALEDLMVNRTTFVIAHRLSTIKRADRIIVLDKGRILESGTHRELYERGGLYRKLYEVQFSSQDAGGTF